MLIFENFLIMIFESPLFLLSTEILSFCCKGFIFFKLIQHIKISKLSKNFLILLLLILGGELFSDFTWALHMIHRYYDPIDIRFLVFLIRISWAFYIIEYQAFGFFIEKLITKTTNRSLLNNFFLTISSFTSIYFFYKAFFKFNDETLADRGSSELILIKFVTLYIFLLTIPSIISALYKLKNNKIPLILKKQLKVFIFYLVIPKLFLEIFHNNPQTFYWPFFTATFQLGNYIAVSISSILMMYAIYFVIRKLMGLRFLNFRDHVQTKYRENFAIDFKEVLVQFSYANDMNYLIRTSQAFLNKVFSIPSDKILMHIRICDPSEIESECNKLKHIEAKKITENFLIDLKTTREINSFLHEHKILIKDEIEFTNFYEQDATQTELLKFLGRINADIFLPIYDGEIIISYIIIESGARQNKLYSNADRDELLIFTNYLGAIINLTRYRNLDYLLMREKELKEELYNKYQEEIHLHESLRKLMRINHKVGVVYHKGRKFGFVNQTAHELLTVDPNIHENDPMTHAFKRLVSDISKYKSSRTISAQDIHGNKRILTGLLGPDEHETLILVSEPEFTEQIKFTSQLLKDPSHWDYLLYLETTETGQLVNKLVPGSSETILNFKIDLLKVALNKKATLLCLPEDDLEPTVALLHNISMRKTLYTIKLTEPEKNNEVAIALFGLNPLFGINENALLEKLNDLGTIFIQNVHFLQRETQQCLAQFLKYGYFQQFKSDRKISSSARIICSTDKDLQILAEQNEFAPELLKELKKMTLTLPSILSLPVEELSELVDGYAQQSIKTKAVKQFLNFTPTDKERLLKERPVSLHELKERVQILLQQKSVKEKINHIVEFDPAFTLKDPELLEIYRLGKIVLKDQKLMTFLWNKFRNQTKIAELLGVNKSSVSKRCKDFGLTDKK